MDNVRLTHTRSEFTHQHINTTCTLLTSYYALCSFKTYTHGNVDKMLVFKNHANASKNCVQEHNCIHTCSIRTQPTNTNHKASLGFTHSYVKQFCYCSSSSGSRHNIQLYVLKSKCPNSNSNSNPNPNAPNYMIWQNLCPKSYLKQFNK